MSDWFEGHIYEFRYQGLLLYQGSTNDMHRRLIEHQSACFNPNSIGYNCKIYKYIRNNDILFSEIEVKIIFTRMFPDMKKMHEWEQRFIDVFKPLCNKYKAYTGMTKKEYKKQYRDEHKEEQKQYREVHKEERKQQMKQYYETHKEKH